MPVPGTGARTPRRIESARRRVPAGLDGAPRVHRRPADRVVVRAVGLVAGGKVRVVGQVGNGLDVGEGHARRVAGHEPGVALAAGHEVAPDASASKLGQKHGFAVVA